MNKDHDNYPYTVNEYAREYNLNINTLYAQIRRGAHDYIRRGAQIFLKDEPPRYNHRGRKGLLQE